MEWLAPAKAGDATTAIERHQVDLALAEGQATILDALRAERDRMVTDLRAAGCPSGPAAVSIPAGWVLLRVTDLPLAAPDELRGMAELQIDKFSPFPTEESAISYELLAERDDRARVLLSAVRTETMDLLGGALQSAGIVPKRVDLNLLGWWRLLNDAGHVHATSAQAFLILDDTCIDLVVTSAGIPLAMRSLTGLGDLPNEEVADEVAREIVYTLTAVDLERTGEHLAEIAVWHRNGDLAEVLIHRLLDPFGLTAKSYALDTLPPLGEGLARRAAEAGPGRLDLAPPAWREAELRRQSRTRLIALTASLLGVWLVAVAILFGGLQYQKQKLARLGARFEQVKAPAELVRATRDRVLGLEQYVNRTHSSLECLREVSDLLPPGIELKSFTYRKGKSVELSGEADAVTLVYDFKKEMEKSSLFTATDLPRTFRTPQGKEVFKITASLPGGATP
jgi:hypothetical protein